MIRYLFRNVKYLIAFGVLIVAEPLLNSFLNLWMAKLFNSAVIGAETLFILRAFVIGFAAWLAKRLVVFSMGVVKKNYLCNVRLEIKRDVFRNVLNKDSADLSSTGSSGEYTSIFLNDINILEERYYDKIIDFVTYCVAIVINGAAFVYLNSTLAVVILVYSVLVSWVPWIVARRLNESSFKYSKKLSTFTQKLKEFFSSYPMIKNYALEKGVLQTFDVSNYDAESAKFQSEYELNLANCIGATLSWFAQIIAIGLGLIMVIRGQLLVGMVVAARAFARDLADPMQNAISNLNSILSVKKIVGKMTNMTQSDDNADMDADVSATIERPDLEYRNVSLTVNDKRIVDDVSFVFEYGKKYLILGTNGAGKSTLFKMMKKKFPQYEGVILIGGKDVADMRSQEIAAYASYMTEKVSIIAGGVIENIKLYRDVSDETLQKAVTDAQVNIDINRDVTDEGNNISSGEQRRIEIARCLCRNASILIFDEVISTLDVKTAYDIEKMVLDYDETVIFISHNFSGKLIELYDEIILIEQGKIVAHGRYEELLQNCEIFREICEIKFGHRS